MSVVLHVGLPKTGTTHLQRLLADHREPLRAVGVLYPFLRPGAMFEGAVEVRGSAAKFGLEPARIAGTWAALCERARGFEGTTVISHEVLGGATVEQVDAALEPLHGLEAHVVVTARDLGRQATAHWQEEVKLGATMSFADFERDQLRADTGRDAGPDAGGVRPHFWHAQDFADALRRWGRGLPPERVHLVIGPAPGAAPSELWQRYADALGVDPALLDPLAAPASNPSLGAPEVALVRAVNRLLGDRLQPALRNRLVKREWAEGVLARRDSPRPRTPAALGEILAAPTRAWVEEVRTAGYSVHGDLADLVPVTAGPGDPAPDQPPPPGEDPAALADEFVARAAGRRSRLKRLLGRAPGL
ncbi:MAG: hypothetical protein M3237_02615 [Actinomycetota bacterium]|nr:hypothetical protein [Actinomycetota bacterium]